MEIRRVKYDEMMMTNAMDAGGRNFRSLEKIYHTKGGRPRKLHWQSDARICRIKLQKISDLL